MFLIIILASSLITGYGFVNMDNVPAPEKVEVRK